MIRSIQVRAGATDPARPRPVAATPPKPPSSINSTTAPLVAEWSRDPRLAPLNAADREHALEEAAGHVIYCENNVTLGNFYDCPCMGGRMLDARLQAGFERILAPGQSVQPGASELKFGTGKLLMNMVKGQPDTSRCVAPDKVRRYAIDRARQQFSIDPEPARTRATECVGRAFPQAFQAKPIPDIQHAEAVGKRRVVSYPTYAP